MARQRIFDVKIDVAQIEALKDRLGQIDPSELGKALVETLNEVTEQTYDLSRKHILSSVNLDDPYIRSRIEVKPATSVSPKAEIVATGEGKMTTGLGHYGPYQLRQGVNWTNSRIQAMGKKIGPWPNWELREGDSGRGISAGEKQAGVTVSVKPGSRKKVKGQVFTIPGIDHIDGSPVLFRGTGETGGGRSKMDRGRKAPRQKAEALYGPSVYQLFATAAKEIYSDVADNLERAVLERAEKEILKVLE